MKFLHVRYSDDTGDVFTVSPDTVMIAVPRGIDHGYKAALEEIAANGRVTLVFGSQRTTGRAVRARSLKVGEEAYARDDLGEGERVHWIRLKRLPSGPTAKRSAAKPKRNPRGPASTTWQRGKQPERVVGYPNGPMGGVNLGVHATEASARKVAHDLVNKHGWYAVSVGPNVVYRTERGTVRWAVLSNWKTRVQ